MCADSQEGNRDNPYTFDDYLFVRDNFDYYSDDEFFQALIQHFIPEEEYRKIDTDLRALSEYVSFRFRDLADSANTLEKRIKVTQVKHYDAHNHRIDRIERCKETEILEREIFSLGLFDPHRNTPWSRFAKMFLLYQNSEAGVMCPIACTHGMVELLQKYEQSLSNEAKKILTHVRDGKEGDYGVGAQFVSEIQGGSDVPANLVEAVYEEESKEDGVENCWRLYGQKFFCSAIQAEYAVVTAKPKNTKSSTKVAAFLVPSWIPGNKEKEIRNSYTIDRLKPKMGTSELPTAEVTYNGAVAYPVGPLDKGVANVVGIVLSISRLHVAFGMAAAGLRIAREAMLYAQFRTAFGLPVASFPLMINQIKQLHEYAQRTAAGAFKIYSEYVHFDEELISGIRDLKEIDDLEERKRRFRLRELIMLQKIVVADEAPAMTRLAISFFGGHGVMEDFLSFPRFLRDAFIMELWEGPRNVLLTQMHRDMQRVREWYPPNEFIKDLLQGADPAVLEELSSDFREIMNCESLLRADEETLSICNKWQEVSNAIFNEYQRIALKEMGYSEKPIKFSHRIGTEAPSFRAGRKCR